MNEVTIGDPSTLLAHPAAALFPMLDENDLRELAEDIRENGLVFPIVVKDSEILDGRNRLRACEIAEVTPRFVAWAGTGSITAWIFSINLHRRHLTPSQRAMLAARSIEMFAAEADKRQKHGFKSDDKGRARMLAADTLGVGHGSVQRAQAVIATAAPELVAAVDRGEVAVAAAADVATLPVEEQRAVVREKKVAERAREVRDNRRPPAPPTSPPPDSAPPPPAPPSCTVLPPPAPPLAPEAASDGKPLSEDEEHEESTLDPRNRPDPQPVPLTAFRAGYRRGSNPKEEAEKVDQILAAARSALHAWRWIVIEWNEDKRWDMKFALHESRELSLHLNQAVAKLEAIAEICHGRKPAPPPEGP